MYRPIDIIKLLLSEPRKYLQKPDYDFMKVKSMVNNRFRSKYAKERWGVKEIQMPDGTIKKYVSEDKLYLWENNPDYRGRPYGDQKGVDNE